MSFFIDDDELSHFNLPDIRVFGIGRAVLHAVHTQHCRERVWATTIPFLALVNNLLQTFPGDGFIHTPKKGQFTGFLRF